MVESIGNRMIRKKRGRKVFKDVFSCFSRDRSKNVDVNDSVSSSDVVGVRDSCSTVVSDDMSDNNNSIGSCVSSSVINCSINDCSRSNSSSSNGSSRNIDTSFVDSINCRRLRSDSCGSSIGHDGQFGRTVGECIGVPLTSYEAFCSSGFFLNGGCTSPSSSYSLSGNSRLDGVVLG